MDLRLNRRKRHQKVNSDKLKEFYPHDVSLYQLPPLQDITLSEFENLAIDRLKVLRVLDFSQHKGFKLYSTEWNNYVFEELSRLGLKRQARLYKSTGCGNVTEIDLQMRRADYISHFILRYAYSRTEELRRWFLNRELDLFKLRFAQLSPQSIKEFLQLNRLDYNPISEEEKDCLRDELAESTAGKFVFDITSFYKVPFEDVLQLTRTRKIFVKTGYAYVPNFELVSCIVTLYRMNLNKGLANFSKLICDMDDERLTGLLNHMHESYIGEDFVENNTGEMTIVNVNSYARDHFPMCMRHIHETLKIDHHLKHRSRLQYILYLKGIGIKFEECMEFWRSEFTKKVGLDTFEKQYSYLVKHSYGKVGGMTNYSPYSCMKIITENVGPGDHHGCPYRHWDPVHIKKKLEEYGLPASHIAGVVEKAQAGHYQVACWKYFEAVNGVENKNPINHPNQYFKDSYELKNSIKKESDPVPKLEQIFEEPATQVIEKIESQEVMDVDGNDISASDFMDQF